MAELILRTLLYMILVGGINFLLQDSQSRRHYKNTSREVLAYDSLSVKRYDSLFTINTIEP